MKICVFTASIDKKGGGPSRSVPILVKGLSKVGVDVTLMTAESDDMNIHSVEGQDVRVVTFRRDISEKDLEGLLLEGHFDLIHAQGIWVPLYHKMCKIARRHGIPYMMTPRGALEPWCYYDHTFFKRIKKQIAMAVYQRNDIQSADCVLATAEMEANSLRDLSFTNPIAVIPNGIEIDEYPCRPVEAITKCKKQVLFLSRVVPKKGLDILINAWPRVYRSFPEWKLLIVGNGEPDYINDLNSRIIKNGLSNIIKILPPAFGSNKYSLYVESSLFVLPTHSENFGMVIAEALACGVPVITTKSAPWQLLEETHSGWWIDLSQDNLEHSLLMALSLPEQELFDMGQRGAEMVRREFYFVEVANKILAVYQWIVNKTEKPPFVLAIDNDS